MCLDDNIFPWHPKPQAAHFMFCTWCVSMNWQNSYNNHHGRVNNTRQPLYLIQLYVVISVSPALWISLMALTQMFALKLCNNYIRHQGMYGRNAHTMLKNGCVIIGPLECKMCDFAQKSTF